MIDITQTIKLDESELSFSYICSPGPGGQNVNKLATAVLLRFNVNTSRSIPPIIKRRLMKLAHNKISSEGDLLIKASCYRTQARNKQDAIDRLKDYIKRATIVPKHRRQTKPTYGSVQKRLQSKKKRGSQKKLRRSKPDE